MIVSIPISDGFYVSSSLPVNNQECINYWPSPVVQSTGEVVAVPLFGTPGINQIETTGPFNQINRGSWVMEGIPFFVNGGNLYRLNRSIVNNVESFSTDNLGVIEGTGRVSMADNGTQLMVLVPGGKGYIFTENPDTFSEITDLDFVANGNPQFVQFMDGFFVITTDDKKFIVSALNDGLSYNALDFGSAEANPDPIVVPFPFKSQLFIPGTEVTEVFSNIGGITFPFQRIQGFILSKGLFAPFSIVETQDTFMWIGGGKNEGPAIWALNGNTTAKISTTAIDTLLAEEDKKGTLSDIFAWSYAEEGGYFVGWTLSDTTIVFDTEASRWHERKSEIMIDNELTTTRWRVNSMVQAYGRLLVADFIDGRIGEANLAIFTEYGEIVKRSFSTRPFQNQYIPFFVPMIELTLESGVGNATNPIMRMSRSTDGKKFTDERARTVGEIGEFDRRQIWYQNGRAARFETFRWEFAEDAKAVVIGAVADIIPAAA